jgi:hypothetical protein
MLFDFLKEIGGKKRADFLMKVDESEKKKLTPYLLNIWISMNKELMPLWSWFNERIFSISLDQYYHICRFVIPKGSYYFQWIKSNKEKKEEAYPDWIIEILKREIEFVSKDHCIEYLDIIKTNENSKQWFIEVLEKYPLEKQQWQKIKKLLNVLIKNENI